MKRRTLARFFPISTDPNSSSQKGVRSHVACMRIINRGEKSLNHCLGYGKRIASHVHPEPNLRFCGFWEEKRSPHLFGNQPAPYRVSQALRHYMPKTGNPNIFNKNQRLAKGAGGKGPRQKTSKIVKKCQKVFRHFSRIFAQGKKRQKSSKSVKKFFDTFRQFSHGTIFPAPFGGAPKKVSATLRKHSPETLHRFPELFPRRFGDFSDFLDSFGMSGWFPSPSPKKRKDFVSKSKSLWRLF